MTKHMRKLNDEGIRRFAEYLASGARGDVPLVLLANPETSDPVLPNVVLSDRAFDNRYDFGFYLKDLFAAFDSSAISGDRNLWTSLALFWFDKICPKRSDDTRDVQEDYRYILSGDYPCDRRRQTCRAGGRRQTRADETSGDLPRRR
jgi:hypothetical protein